jgi:hypothetical protein
MSYAVVEDIGTSGPALEAMIPSGGSQGQVLSVLSASPRVLGWGTASGSGGGGSATWGTITGTLWNQADLSQALASKAPLASPTFTGTVTTPSLKFTTSPQAGYVLTSDASGNMSLQLPASPSAQWGNIGGTLSAQSDLASALASKAPLASPTFTGTVTAPAITLGSNDLSQALASKAPLASPTFTGTVTTPSLKFTTSPQAGYVLTSDASGNMSLQPSAAGHTIEASGSAMTQRPALNFTGSGVSVTDDSVNNATVVTISGGSDLVQTYPGGGNAYIPGLRGSPDSIPSSPSAYNDEFDTFSGWTTIGTLDVLNVTDRISHLHMVKKATGTMTISGVYKPSPTPPFTVTAKRSDFSYWTNYQQCALMIGANPPGGMLVFGTTADTSTPNKSEWDVWTSPTSRSSYNVNQWILYPQFCPYWRIVVHSSTSVDLSFSYGGTVFLSVASGINPGFTVGSVGFTLTGNDYSVYTEVLWDWIRFT